MTMFSLDGWSPKYFFAFPPRCSPVVSGPRLLDGWRSDQRGPRAMAKKVDRKMSGTCGTVILNRMMDVDVVKTKNNNPDLWKAIMMGPRVFFNLRPNKRPPFAFWQHTSSSISGRNLGHCRWFLYQVVWRTRMFQDVSWCIHCKHRRKVTWV